MPAGDLSHILERTKGALSRLGESTIDLICERPLRVIGLVALLAATILTAHVNRVESNIMRQAALQNAAHYAKALAMRSSGDREADLDGRGRVRRHSPYAEARGVDSTGFSDPFVRDAWQRLSLQPHTPFHRYETVRGQPSVRYAVADTAGPDCTWCTAAGLASGQLSGVFEVVMPLSSSLMLARMGSWDTFVLSLLLASIGVTGLAFLVSWLKKKSDAAQSLAEQQRRANEALQTEITQRERAEEELAVANSRLTTNHATLERWAAELEIAHSRLREVDQLKTKFLSEVSHELRSPVAAIVSAAKIITKHHESKPEVVDRFGNTIVSEGNRMTRLINDFLDLTKVESGCIDWNDGPLEAQALLGDAIHGLDSLALDSGVTLRQDVDDDVPTLNIDRDRLFQVLTNLANNAIKFTPAGGSVTLRASRTGNLVTFAVCDTGPGIPEEDLSKVFDRFHQVRSKAEGKTQQKGTGLGLCISREIVEHYGGRIWVESEVGHGSAFMFTIPVDSVATGAAPDMTTADQPGAQAVRVLMMLDDEQLTASALAVPATEGIACRACTSLDEMAEAAAAWSPDVLVVSENTGGGDSAALFQLAHEHGIDHVLVHSAEHGLTSPSLLDSSNLLVPSLRGLIAPGAQVMVVDDNEKYRGLLEFEIREAGYDVQSVESGQDALDSVAHEAPEAMVLDLVMPGIDGLTVLERLRKTGIDFPVLVYTAMDDPGVALAAKQLGATEVFRKDEDGQTGYAAVAARVRRVLTPALTGKPAAQHSIQALRDKPAFNA